jgi:hypothetical protein
MNYVGVDIHKKYSVLCALDETRRKVGEACVEGNAPSGFARFFVSLDGPSKAREAVFRDEPDCARFLKLLS